MVGPRGQNRGLSTDQPPETGRRDRPDLWRRARVLVWWLLDEERLLVQQLPGYGEHREKTRFRLIPLVW